MKVLLHQKIGMMKHIVICFIISALMISSIQPSYTNADTIQKSSPVYQEDHIVFVSQEKGTNDEKPLGSIENPFSTIQEAQEALKGKTTKDNPGIIYLRKGTYNLKETIKVSGSEYSYVTYAAYDNEKVKITTSDSLPTSKFKKLEELTQEEINNQFSSSMRINNDVRGKVWAYDLGSEDIPAGTLEKNGFGWDRQPSAPELVVNGNTQILSRYPNDNKTMNIDNINVLYKGERPRTYADYPESTNEQRLSLNGPVYQLIGDKPTNWKIWGGPASQQQIDALTNSTIDESTKGLPLDNEAVDNTKQETDAWLTGYMGNNWSTDMTKIYSIDEDSATLFFKYPIWYSAEGTNWSFYAMNLLCELDAPGEYYIDRYADNNVLYYYPTEGVMENSSSEIILMDRAISFFELSEVDGVNLYGLSMSNTASNGILITDSNDCCISDCEISNVTNGAVVVNGGSNVIFNNCKIHDCGDGGIWIKAGDSKSLTPANHIVQNCEIYNFSKTSTYTPGISLIGCGSSAVGNYIHDCPHQALVFKGQLHTIEENKFIRVCMNASDMGAIYTGGNLTDFGNKIQYNYLESTPGVKRYLIYMDQAGSGYIVKNNILKGTDCAIAMVFGSGITNTDNIFINIPSYIYVGQSWDSSISFMKSAKVLDRWNELMTTNEGCNTAENIQKWYNTFNKDNPEYGYTFNLEDWKVPSSSGTDFDKNDPANVEHGPRYNVIKRNISVGTYGFSLLNEEYRECYEYYNPEFTEDDNYSTLTTSDLGLDLKTGKISETSPLADKDQEEKGFGKEWIENWNKHFNLSDCGIKSIDKSSLWQYIDKVQYSLENESEEIKSIQMKAHAVAVSGVASQDEVDSICKEYQSALKEAVTVYTLSSTKIKMQNNSESVLSLIGQQPEDRVTYSSSNVNIATVDALGKIIAVGGGQTQICCEISTGAGNKITLYCDVTVFECVNLPVYGPADGEQNVNRILNIRWDTIPNTSEYEVTFSKSEDFTKGIITVHTGDTQTDVNGLAANQLYYWKVAAYNDEEDCIADSGVRSFTTAENYSIRYDFEGDDKAWFANEGWICTTSYSTTTSQSHSGDYALILNTDTVNLRKEFKTPQTNTVSIWMYDNMQPGQRSTNDYYRAYANVSTSYNDYTAIAIDTYFSNDCYVIRLGSQTTTTEVQRSEGWHELKWDFSSGTDCNLYIDDKLIKTVEGVTYFKEIMLFDNWIDRISNVIFDDIEISLPVNNLKVTDGSGSGEYLGNSFVNIIADQKEDSVFNKWVCNDDDVVISDVYSEDTTVLMPMRDIDIYAEYMSKEEAAAIQNVIDAISEIENIVPIKEFMTAVEAARNAFNELSDDQKVRITNIRELDKAEASIESMNQAVTGVKEKISAIGEVSYSQTSKEKIDAARMAYNALDDSLKNMITDNELNTLSAAEDRYNLLKNKAEEATQETETTVPSLDVTIDSEKALNSITVVNNDIVLTGLQKTVTGFGLQLNNQIYWNKTGKQIEKSESKLIVTIKYVSDNPKVVTVTKYGVIVPKSVGSAKVRAIVSTMDGCTKEFVRSVIIKDELAVIHRKQIAKEIKVGERVGFGIYLPDDYKLVPNYLTKTLSKLPEGTIPIYIRYSSLDSSVAKVSKTGMITGVSKGNTKINATVVLKGGKFTTYKINVTIK